MTNGVKYSSHMYVKNQTNEPNTDKNNFAIKLKAES